MSSNFKVLITTSGTGSRLGELTKHLNKALIRIGKKPAISYIIEKYPEDVPFVVTVGYQSEQIKEFLPLAYPERIFEFVEVEPYQGSGSSLGFSMLRAKEKLQCPFIFHCCDTIVSGPIPAPVENWVGGYEVKSAKIDFSLDQYRTHIIENGKIIKLNEKGAVNFNSVHIGLIGIRDYVEFWKNLDIIYETDPKNTGHSDVHVLDRMIQNKIGFKLVSFDDWCDTGTPEALKRTRHLLGENFEILDKPGESTYLFKTNVIKFFSNDKVVSGRVQRGVMLKGLVPPLEGFTPHFYRYKYVEGDLYARVVNPDNFKIFLHWIKWELWKPVNEVGSKIFSQTCHDFYEKKTYERVSKFFEITGLQDRAEIINGESIPSLKEMLSRVDFNWLVNTEQTQFHGDLILDNIIKTKTGYCLLDWRQNFGGLLQAGDKYYDLAKLNHNLTVNHDVINEERFSVNINSTGIILDIERLAVLVECQKTLSQFIDSQGWNWKKIELLTSLIWLNMSPLHPTPKNFNLFLFFFGKLHLWHFLKKQL
jgi:NDP-sugar pyrophosphorylase family protein